MRTVSRASPCAQGTSVRVSGLDTKKIVSNLKVKNIRCLKVNLGSIGHGYSAGNKSEIWQNNHFPSDDQPLSNTQTLFAIDLFVIQL